MSVDHGAVRGYDHKAGGGGNTLDLVKHVLLRDEVNAIRWLRGQGLIDSPRHDRENAVGAAARRERVNRWRGRLRSQRMVDSCRQCRTLRTLARACIYDCGNAAYWERCRVSPQAPTSVPRKWRTRSWLPPMQHRSSGAPEASVSCDGPVPVVGSEGAFAPSSIRLAPTRLVTMERTDLGCEIETALGEVLAHVRDETGLSCRIVDDPAASRIVALRKRLRLSRQKFADRFGLDVRAVQEWEQGRRVPDRAARVLLTVIDRDPEAVVRALGEDGGDGRPGDSSAL